MNWLKLKGYTELMMYDDPGDPDYLGHLENIKNQDYLANQENQENQGHLENLDQMYDSEFFNCTQVANLKGTVNVISNDLP